MAFDPRKARIANQLIQQGLSEEQALIQAGVSPQDFDLYSINQIGTPATNPNFGQIESSSFAGIQSRPDQTTVSAGQDPDINDDEDIFQRAEVTSQNTTTTQTTQITGGGSTTRRVVPTQYQDNPTSQALQNQAADLQAQKDARSAAIRAQGGTGRDVLADPEFRRLSNEQTQVEYDAERARTPVPNTGGIITTTTPGADRTTTTQTVDGNFVTTRGSGFDPQAQSIEADNTAILTPASSFAPTDVSADDVAAVGQFQAGTADDVPTTFNADSLAPQLSPFGEEDEPQEFRVISSAPEPLGPDISPFGEENEFVEDDTVSAFDPTAVSADDFAAVGQFETATADDIASVREPVPQLDPYEIDGLGAGELTEEEIQQQDNTNAVPAGLQAQVNQARQQASIQQNRNRPATSDWRVRLRLLPQADYLYKDAENAGILRPLKDQDGVIFPYMPRISTSYLANYDKYDLTHSNYRGYFYKNSSVQEITIEGVFTAQDTKEAEYLLAVIHFFRSVTKMFYGQDKYRGAPPPLVELFGLGQYQFNYHPCLVSQFSYNLPNDVDYIRTDINNFGLNLSQRQERVSSSPTPTISSVLRKINNGLSDGAEPQRRDVGTIRQTVSGLGVTTYVPTKMTINITLLPVQNRQQISSEFSVKEFANGVLLRGGFW